MIILLNGPPRSGKDTAAEFIIQLLGNSKVYHDKLSKPMKSGLRTIFDFKSNEMQALEAYKEESNGPDYGGHSWRAMQIHLFQHLETTYGSDILGKLFIRRNKNNGKVHTVVSDCGRSVELIPIVKDISYGQLGLIRLSRPNCDYSNDIREDVRSEGIKHLAHIDNIHDMDMFKVQIRRVLVKWKLLEAQDELD
jgi:hypothetical protein